MNNLIRELVNQADIEVAHMECNRPRIEFEIKQQWVEKFAELIVRECADYVTTGTYDATPPYDVLIPVLLNELAKGMKKHFGVE